MSTDVERLTLDGLTQALLEAEEHALSLASDVRTYREMAQLLLTELASQIELNRRLMWRLSPDNKAGNRG